MSRMDKLTLTILLVAHLTAVMCEPFPTALLCITPSVNFDRAPNIGSQNYGGVLSFKGMPYDDTNPSFKGVCECTLESVNGSHFDIMLKSRVTQIDDKCSSDPSLVCADRLEVDYTTSAGVTSHGMTVISQESWQADGRLEERYKQFIRSAVIRYTDQPDHYDLIHRLELEVIATQILRVSCRFNRYPTSMTFPERQPDREDPETHDVVDEGEVRKYDGKKEETNNDSGALITTAIVISVICALIVCFIIGFFVYKKASNNKKQGPGYFSNRVRYNKNNDDRRYVSLETMQKSNGKIGEIDDTEESISFDTPRSKGGATSQSSATVTLDLSNSGNGNSGYEYIETVDYFQQAGSEPTSPESALPSLQNSTNSPVPATYLNMETGRIDESNASPQVLQRNCAQDSNVYENLENRSSDTTTTSKNSPQNNYCNLPNGVHNTNNLLVEPTKENGYGKGAIPKRPKESYYQVWGGHADRNV